MRTLAIVVLLFLVLFLGCVKINMGIDVHPNGRGDVDVKMDMSGLATLGSYGGTTGDTENTMATQYSKENICDTYRTGNTSSLPSTYNPTTAIGSIDPNEFECVPIGDYKFQLIAKDVDLSANELLKVEETFFSKRYILTYKSEGSTVNPVTASSMGALKATGAEMTLTIRMPGTILSATHGTISSDKKKVEIDLIEEAANLGDDVVIVSEEVNILVAGGVILAILAVGGFLVHQNRHAKAKKKKK